MPVHWTEFPEQIVLFGDLFSVYETLDQHTIFNFESFPDHAMQGAYSVDFRRGKWQVTPRSERMPGLDRLLELLEREGHYTLTLELMRELRRRTMNALKCDRARVNAMTLNEVADALDVADQPAAMGLTGASADGAGVTPSTRATRATPDPSQGPNALAVTPAGGEKGEPVPQRPCGIVYPPHPIEAESLPSDLRDSLAAAWSLVWHANVLVFWLKSSIGLASQTVRAIENQGTPQERVVAEYPPALTVTAETVINTVEQVDRYFQLCTERLRTTLRSLIACGDAYADGELHASCAHEAALRYAADIRQKLDILIRITPRTNSSVLVEGFIHASELREIWKDFLRVFRSSPHNFDRVPSSDKLLAALLREAVKTAATRGQLSHEPVEGRRTQDSVPARPVSPKRPSIVITDDGTEEAGSPSEPRPRREPVGHVPRVSDRLGGLFRRVAATTPAAAPPEPSADRIEAAALRLCEVMASDEFGWTGEDGVRLILADVAQRGPGIEPSPFNRELTAAFHHAVCWLFRANLVTLEMIPRQQVKRGRDHLESDDDTSGAPLPCLKATQELWKRRDAGRIFTAAPINAEQPSKTASDTNPRRQPQRSATSDSKQPDRNEGGRPKLGEGPNATQQEKALRNVYELIRSASQPGQGPKALLSHFRNDKDFKDRVREAGKDCNESLFKAALAWLKENPYQETQPGNVS